MRLDVGGWIGRPGGDLLSRALRHSTMGAGVFHGRVRDGIGCRLPAMATRSSNPPGPGFRWRRLVCEGLAGVFVCVRCGNRKVIGPSVTDGLDDCCAGWCVCEPIG